MGAITHHQLIYTTSGDPSNPPLMLIHGWGAHRGVWRTTVPSMQYRFYCIAVDLWGFADNEKPDDGDYSIGAQAQRVVMLADGLGFKTFNLMGYSMGEQIATYTAAVTAPERVVRLVSVGGVVTGQLSPYMKYIMWPNTLWGRAMPVVYDLSRRWVEQYRWYANYIFRTWFYDMDFTAFEDWKIDRLLALQRSASKSLANAFRSIRKTNLTPHLDRIQAKTLILIGTYDGAVPVNEARLLKERVANDNLCSTMIAVISQCSKKLMRISQRLTHSSPVEKEFHEPLPRHPADLRHCHCLPSPDGLLRPSRLDRKQAEPQIYPHRNGSDLRFVLGTVS